MAEIDSDTLSGTENSLFQKGAARRLIRPQFMVGLSVHLDMVIDGRPIKTRVNVAGWVEDQVLLLTAPAFVMPTLQPNFDGPVTFRYLLDGVIYGFRAGIARRILKPTRLWMVDYPMQVEFRTLRKQVRTSVLIPTKASLGGHVHEGLILDLSAGGALLSLPTIRRNLKIDDKVSLEFQLPGGGEIRGLEANIRCIRASEGFTHLGVQFQAGDETENVARFLAGLPNLNTDGESFPLDSY